MLATSSSAEEPGRKPACFVRAATVNDVVAAVHLAKARPEDNENWATECARLFKPVRNGSQLADENLARCMSSFMAVESCARLEQVRGEFDPEGRIHSYGHLDQQANSGDLWSSWV